MKFKTIIKIFVIGLIIFIYIFYSNNKIVETYYEIENPKIPQSFDGFRIVQVSDLHNKNFHGQLENLVKKSEPDIIVLTGDIIDYFFKDEKMAYETIENLTNIAPTYYVSGNHEKGLGYQKIKDSLESIDVIILDNESEKLIINNESIMLSGIKDFNFNKNIDYDLSQVTNEENNFNILLAHQPKYFNKYKEYGFDLILSGHEHGGQIRIPFIGAFYSSHQGFFPKLTEGITTLDNSQIIVSRGLGSSGRFPIRIFNNPELVIIDLKHK